MSTSKILIVEPDPQIRTLLEQRCSDLLPEVVSVAGFADAKFQLHSGNFDLCIAPVSLVDGLGYRFYEFCLSTHPNTRIILRCEIPEVMDAIQATRVGVFAFFPWNGPTTEFDHLITAALKTEKRKANSSWRKRMVHRCTSMEQVLDEIDHISRSERPVHITGPSGSGKKLAAELIHSASKRRDGCFVTVDCRTSVDEELSNLLFGHVAGAFPGAFESDKGALLRANSGVLFLHHVDAMPRSVQHQLLMALQQNAVRPLGSSQLFETDFRLITSSDRSLDSELNAGNFLDELYNQIFALEINLPPLSSRPEDIPHLAKHRADGVYKRRGQAFKGFSNPAMQVISQVAWPGNVRQLFTIVDQIIDRHCNTMQVPESIVKSILKSQPRALPNYTEAKAKFERDYLVQLMILADGNVAQAARMAERNRTDFYKLLNRNNLDASSFKSRDGSQPDLKLAALSESKKTG